jgi:hypothetical protein
MDPTAFAGTAVRRQPQGDKFEVQNPTSLAQTEIPSIHYQMLD